MKIDLSELERKLSYGINLTIKESTILIESLKCFIDDKIELEEQLKTAKKALTSIKWRTERDELETYYVERNHDIHKDAIDALAAIGNEGSGDE